MFIHHNNLLLEPVPKTCQVLPMLAGAPMSAPTTRPPNWATYHRCGGRTGQQKPAPATGSGVTPVLAGPEHW